MKNIAFLSGIFAMMSCNFAIGSSFDEDEIVGDQVTVRNPVFGIKSPCQKRAALSKAGSSSSPYGNRSPDAEERTPLPVPLLFSWVREKSSLL